LALSRSWEGNEGIDDVSLAAILQNIMFIDECKNQVLADGRTSTLGSGIFLLLNGDFENIILNLLAVRPVKKKTWKEDIELHCA